MKNYRFWLRSFFFLLLLTLLLTDQWFIPTEILHAPFFLVTNFVFAVVTIIYILYLLIEGFGYPFKHWKEEKAKSLLQPIACSLVLMLIFAFYYFISYVVGDLFFEYNFQSYSQVIKNIEKQNYPNNLPSVYKLPDKFKYLNFIDRLIVDKKDNVTTVFFHSIKPSEVIEYSSSGKSYFNLYYKRQATIIRKRANWFRIIN